MSDDSLPQAHLIYSGYVKDGSRAELAEILWGVIPANMGEAASLLKGIRDKYGSPPEDVEGFRKALKGYQRELGLLTGRVGDRIDSLDAGVVEAGQQPMCLAGTSLILNKIAYAHTLCAIGGGYVPVFYNADYDGVQAELLNIRLPSPSARGLLITYPAGPEYEGSPIHMLPNPPEEWLTKTVEKITSNYRGIMKDVKPETQERVMRNLDHILIIVRGAYYSTDNVSDWAAKIIGTVVNLEADLGVPIVSPSKPEIRPFFQRGYETLLAEPNRSGFIEATNEAAERVEAYGFRPQIGRRGRDYVPFFLECSNPGCNRARIETRYVGGGSTASVKGRCPRCETEYEYSFSASSPDLSEVIDWISPRVDSRQVIVDSAMPVLAHVGGPGETSYYAEVVPAAQRLGLPFPVYLRYTRAFYNTPWNEAYGEEVKAAGHPTILGETLFDALGEWVKARNDGDGEALKRSHDAIEDSIEDTYSSLVAEAEALQSDVDSIKSRLGKAKDRGTLIKEMRMKQSTLSMVEQYLSWAYGRFSPERRGQEVSWAWIDLALVTGVTDVVGVYLRQYNEYTPNSSMYF
ncbi:MAG TPA: bacillithiol biosynthesis BshC, partial [Candidatus Desulfaltia sp.]|nr:bacillithiol biosynthesis BshC [Candidatus Desulfaltia sp.]